MFLVNLVRLLLLVGVLYESGADAAEHQREQPSDLRELGVSLFDEYVKYSLNRDTDALLNLYHPDARILLDGFPTAVGREGIRCLLESISEKASRIKNTFKEVHPMDEDANYVYVVFHYDYFNESGDDYIHGSAVDILKKTPDGYKFYIVMFNKHEDD